MGAPEPSARGIVCSPGTSLMGCCSPLSHGEQTALLWGDGCAQDEVQPILECTFGDMTGKSGR